MCINKQQTVIIGGKERSIDDCLVPIVTALNSGGVPTVACCCGHGRNWGNIMLADGRELIIAPDFESARAFDKVHSRPIHDERSALLNLELAATTANNARDETTPELVKCSQCANYVRGEICKFVSCGIENEYKDFKGVASPVA